VKLKGRCKVLIEDFERYLKEKVPAFEEIAILKDKTVRRLVGDCFEDELERVPARHWEELEGAASAERALAKVNWSKPAVGKFKRLTPTLRNVGWILRDLSTAQRTILEKILMSVLDDE
jgi:hypothetical protein